MRTLFRLLFVLCLLTFKLQAQTYPCDVGPQIIQAHSLIASNSIYLVWPANVYRLELTVSRRAFVRDAHAWNDWVQLTSITDTNISQLAGSYKDTGVSSGVHYEYKIMSRVPPYDCNDNSITQYGYRRYQYISAGWDLPVQDSRGNVVLLVESGIATPLAEKLTRLQNDLIGDGYKVIRHDVAAVDVTAGTSWTNAVWSTRNLVKADYASDTTATWYLFIVGHVPVPYSGLSSPGSHTENFGAHPSDWFYAEMNDSAWTDTTANDTTATDSPTNWNIPNDGKLDQRFVPEIPEFRVGRVDFRNMPAFGKSETELLAQYLNRNHAWRTKGYTVRSRGLIIPSGNPMEMIDVASSQFGTTTNIDSSLWRSIATNSFKSYLFSESNSSGGYDHDNTLGFTSDFAATHLYVAFPSSFGSYYGDWDSAIHPDIFSWSALASEGYAVAWYYHENGMNLNTSSMDEPIGNELYSIAANWWRSPASRYLNYTRIVSGSEFDISEQMQAYVSLLGDPTLRWNQISPPKYVSASVNGSDKVIKWEASPESSIEGYHVYRAPSSDLNSFTRLTSSPTTLLTYTDTGAGAGSYRYMVRTVKKVVTTGRSFYTMSEGILSLRGRHVEKTGNDTTGDGSMSAPYLTVQKAVDVSVAGDMIYIGSGVYSENVRTSTSGGVAESPIVINGQGGVRGTGSTIGSLSWEFPYIHTINLTIKGGINLWNGFLYIPQNASSCVLSNCLLDAENNTALTPVIRWNGPASAPFGTAGSDNVIVNNEIKNVRGEMVFRMYGYRNYAAYNYIHDVDNTDYFQISGGTNYIIGNVCSNQYNGGLNPNNHADFVQIFGNAGGSMQGSMGHVVESNIVVKSDGLAQICNLTDDTYSYVQDLTFRNNIFWGIAAKGSISMPKVKWYNCVFYQCATNLENGGSVLNVSDVPGIGNGSGSEIINCIFLDCGIAGTRTAANGSYTFDTTLTNVIADYNYVGKDGYQIIQKDEPLHRPVGNAGGNWDKFGWWEVHGFNGGDPLLSNPNGGDFHLQTGSFLVNAGYTIPGWSTTDYDGVYRPQATAWDIGAFEVQFFPQTALKIGGKFILQGGYIFVR